MRNNYVLGVIKRIVIKCNIRAFTHKNQVFLKAFVKVRMTFENRFVIHIQFV